MPAAAPSKSWVLTRDEAERLFRAAEGGALITYAGGPNLLHGETSRYVHRLYEDGLADLRQPRGENGFEFQLRKRPAVAEAMAGEPGFQEADPALDAIERALRRAANMELRCPSDTALAKEAGLTTRNAAAWRVNKLKKKGVIRTHVEEGPDGAPWRIVTIVETKKTTLLPPKLRAGRRSVRAVGADDGAPTKRGRRWE